MFYLCGCNRFLPFNFLLKVYHFKHSFHSIMLDQSFSAKNFRTIFDLENRKGNISKIYTIDSEIFRPVKNIKAQIKDKIEEKQRESRNLKKIKETNRNYDKLNEIKKQLKELANQKDTAIEQALENISKSIEDNKNFKVKLEKVEMKKESDKPLYTVQNKLEDYFVIKQVQYNIYKTFGVKQKDRRLIISQLQLLLNDGFPKLIIRTDIKKFYESIPHERLLSKINENNLLNPASKKVIKDVLNQYWTFLIESGEKTKEDKRIGIPRGAGISAYLSELYMRSIDKKIKALPNITYYARYVDDIVMIITPNHTHETKTEQDYKNEIRQIIEHYDLTMNDSEEKTKCIDFRKDYQPNKELTYLGYKFVSTKNGFIVKMSENKLNKLNRYKVRITKAFEEYKHKTNLYPTKTSAINRHLIQRIKLLTKNYCLDHSKAKVFVGIYYSNEFLTNTEDLDNLDILLQSFIDSLCGIAKPKFIEKLKQFSFRKGFDNQHECQQYPLAG